MFSGVCPSLHAFRKFVSIIYIFYTTWGSSVYFDFQCISFLVLASESQCEWRDDLFIIGG